MRRYVGLIALGLLGLVFAVTPLLRMLPTLNYVPLERSANAGREAALPTNSVVLNVAEDGRLTSPFEVRPDASAACGKIVVLAEGRATKNLAGRILLEVDCPSAAARHAWARVRWNDSCGNSLALQFDDDPPIKVGQDALYRSWHWVGIGELPVTRGTHTIVLSEREDGVAVDQLLLLTSAAVAPSGSYGAKEESGDVRCFADDFARSPGHGLGGWSVVSGDWGINFDLDPNRIPNQYALGVDHGGTNGAAVVCVDGPAWKGCRLAVSFSVGRAGRLGVVMTDSPSGDPEGEVRVTVNAGEEGLALHVAGPGMSSEKELAVSEHSWSGQWHRLVVERWAWLLRVSLDGQVVFTTTELPARPEVPGLFVETGEVAFDDVSVTEIPWVAEDGTDFRMAWDVSEDAGWYRRQANSKKSPLLGRHGVIAVPGGPRPFYAMCLEEDGESHCTVDAPFAREIVLAGGTRLFSGNAGSKRSRKDAIRIDCGGKTVRIRRAAVAFGAVSETTYCEGPYHFTRSRIEDPADYLDFTDAELKKIRESPDVEKLRRGHRWRPLVGPAIAEGIWRPEGGKWGVRLGCLWGIGPGAVRFWRDYLCDVDLRMKVRMCTDDARTDIVLYEGLGSALTVSLGGDPADAGEGGTGLHLATPGIGEWYGLHVRYRCGRISARIDDGDWVEETVDRGPGGGVLLAIPSGRVEFDDIEILAPHGTACGRFYAFDRMETDWRREGGDWVDHGGINCVLASSWIALLAPEGRGMLWNKRRFGSDLLVHVTLNANSVWYGWNKNPTHEHYPYDNICAVLSPSQDPDKGYRLEVNSRDRTATVLYRNGREVAVALQDKDFPMKYIGGHFPFTPRVGTVALWKNGAELVGSVNGREVLKYTDPKPLPVCRVGVGGYDTRVNLALIQVRGNEQ
jgi:hypothetical protein